MATRQGVERETPKKRGRPFWASSDEHVDCEARRPTRRFHPRLTLDSPSLTLNSPALRVGAGKSGVGGGEWKVSSPQFSVLFYCQDAVTTQLKLWTTVVSHGHESHLNPLTAHKSHRHQMASRQSLFPLYPHFFHVRFQIIATNRTNCISLGACLQNRDTGGRDEETLDASILPY